MKNVLFLLSKLTVYNINIKRSTVKTHKILWDIACLIVQKNEGGYLYEKETIIRTFMCSHDGIDDSLRFVRTGGTGK